MRLSLGARLSLLFAAATASVSLIAGALFDRASEAHFLELDNQLLASRAEALRSLLGPVGSAEALAARKDDLHAELQRQPDLALRILGPQGELWFDSQAVAAHAQHGETAWRAYGTELLPGQADSPRLDLRLDITHHQHFLERMQRLIWLTVGLSALATALLGAWAVRSGLRPLRQMAEVAAGISAHSLTTRLDPASVPAELSDLVSAFNAMLARLEDAFQRLSAFSGDIAHELRTPLSNLLTQTQVTLAQPRDLATYREALHSNLEELQHLAQMVNDMLFLAKAEHGLLTTRREPLVLADELEALAEFFAPWPRKAASASPAPAAASWRATAPCCAAPSPTCWTTPCASPRPAAPSHSAPATPATRCAWRWPTRARPSPPNCNRACSTASSAPTRPAAKARPSMPGSAWPSPAPSSAPTAARSAA